MADELDSIKALSDFVDHWRDKLPGSCFQPTGNMKFDADVSYAYQSKVISGQATVYLTRNGYDDGKVNLLQSTKFVPTVVYTEFKPPFQTYAFKESTGQLIVNGPSGKLGAYTVTINPA